MKVILLSFSKQASKTVRYKSFSMYKIVNLTISRLSIKGNAQYESKSFTADNSIVIDGDYPIKGQKVICNSYIKEK